MTDIPAHKTAPYQGKLWIRDFGVRMPERSLYPRLFFELETSSFTRIYVFSYWRLGLTACFDSGMNPQWLDKKSFKFGYHLLDHPALFLESLSRVIPTLLKNQVMYSKGLLSVDSDFE